MYKTLVTKIKASFKRPFVRPQARIFPSIDVAEARIRLDLEALGTKNGSENMPPSDTTQMDDVELSIYSEVVAAQSEYKKEYDDQLAAYESRLQRLKTFVSGFGVATDSKISLSNISGSHPRRTAELYKVEKDLGDLATTILNFRKKGGLMDRIPDATGTGLLCAAQLAAVSVVEVMLAFLLLEGSDAPADLLALSAVFILLNVVLAYLIAHLGFKQIHSNHNEGQQNIPMRCIGWLSLATWLILVLVVNFGFGHLRSALLEVKTDIDLQIVGQEALRSFLENGILLPDTYAYGLAMLGMFISLFAFYKGYVHNDKYPGYGHWKARWDKEFRQYTEHLQSLENEIQEDQRRGTQGAKAAVTQINEYLHEITVLESRKTDLPILFQDAREQLETDMMLLLQIYRQANIKARTDSPPKHFNERPDLPEVKLPTSSPESAPSPDEDIREIEKSRDEIIEETEKTMKEIQHIKKVLNDEYPFRVEPYEKSDASS